MTIEQVLDELAESQNASLSWDFQVNQYVTAVRAHTSERFEDPASAFAAGRALLDRLCAEGYTVGPRVELAASLSDWDAEGDQDATTWRGRVDVALRRTST